MYEGKFSFRCIINHYADVNEINICTSLIYLCLLIKYAENYRDYVS